MGELITNPKAIVNQISGLTEDIAIVVDGDKSAIGAAEGQYVLLRNSSISGVADGAYKASKAIPADTALDSTYFTSISGGVANDLNSNMFIDISRLESVSVEYDAVEHSYTVPYDGWYCFYTANDGTDGKVSIRLRNSDNNTFFMLNPTGHDAYLCISTGMYHFKQGTILKYRLQSTALGLIKYVKDI